MGGVYKPYVAVFNAVFFHYLLKYQQILNEDLTAPSSKLKIGCGWTFQQDNQCVYMMV